MESETKIDGNRPRRPSALYLAFAFVGAFGLVWIYAFAGMQGWSFVVTVLVGGTVQLVFRLAKNAWLNGLDRKHVDHETGDQVTLDDLKMLMFAYAFMVIMVAFWYGVGWTSNWVWNRF